MTEKAPKPNPNTQEMIERLFGWIDRKFLIPYIKDALQEDLLRARERAQKEDFSPELGQLRAKLAPIEDEIVGFIETSRKQGGQEEANTLIAKILARLYDALNPKPEEQRYPFLERLESLQEIYRIEASESTINIKYVKDSVRTFLALLTDINTPGSGPIQRFVTAFNAFEKINKDNHKLIAQTLRLLEKDFERVSKRLQAGAEIIRSASAAATKNSMYISGQIKVARETIQELAVKYPTIEAK